MNLSPERHRRAHPEREIGGRAAGRLTCLERAENESMAHGPKAGRPKGISPRGNRYTTFAGGGVNPGVRVRAWPAMQNRMPLGLEELVASRQARVREGGEPRQTDRQRERLRLSLAVCRLHYPFPILSLFHNPQSRFHSDRGEREREGTNPTRPPRRPLASPEPSLWRP